MKTNKTNETMIALGRIYAERTGVFRPEHMQRDLSIGHNTAMLIVEALREQGLIERSGVGQWAWRYGVGVGE